MELGWFFQYRKGANRAVRGTQGRWRGFCAFCALKWISRYPWQTMDLDDYANLKRWYVELANRPAVQRGYDVPKKVQDIPMP